MWTIHAMRDINAADPVGGLGPRVTPAPTPAPAPVPIGNGIIRAPDGKLSTDLPDPTAPAPILCKCGLTPAACAMTSCSPQSPAEPSTPGWPFPQRACVEPGVPDGAMWREKDGPLFFRWDAVNDRAELNNPDDYLGWTTSDVEWVRGDFDNGVLFERIAAPPAALRVGDRVRLIGETIWQPAYLGRIGLVVTTGELVEIAVDESLPVSSRLEFEGVEWERA
jgi:hypothetical protein